MIHNGHYESANTFLAEADVPISRPQNEVHLKPHELLETKVLMDSSDTFLLQWWKSLWNLNQFVKEQPLEYVTNMRPFIDAITPILPISQQQRQPANFNQPPPMHQQHTQQFSQQQQQQQNAQFPQKQSDSMQPQNSQQQLHPSQTQPSSGNPSVRTHNVMGNTSASSKNVLMNNPTGSASIPHGGYSGPPP